MASAHQIDDRGCMCTFRLAPFSRRGFVAGAALVLAAAAVRAVGAVEGIPAIAAAADLNYALREIADHFSKDTGKDVRLSFGSSGDFTTQIRQGAPFQVFLSADEEYVEALNKEGKTDGEGTLYAVGRIGLFAPTGSPLKVDGELRDLTAALKDGGYKNSRSPIRNTRLTDVPHALPSSMLGCGERSCGNWFWERTSCKQRSLRPRA